MHWAVWDKSVLSLVILHWKHRKFVQIWEQSNNDKIGNVWYYLSIFDISFSHCYLGRLGYERLKRMDVSKSITLEVNHVFS